MIMSLSKLWSYDNKISWEVMNTIFGNIGDKTEEFLTLHRLFGNLIPSHKGCIEFFPGK